MAVYLAVSTQYTYVTDARQTPHDGIGRDYAQRRAAKKSLGSASVSRIPLAPAERSETCLTTPLNNSKAVLTHYLGHILNDNLRDDDDIQRECMCVQIFYYVNLVNAVLM